MRTIAAYDVTCRIVNFHRRTVRIKRLREVPRPLERSRHYGRNGIWLVKLIVLIVEKKNAFFFTIGPPIEPPYSSRLYRALGSPA